MKKKNIRQPCFEKLQMDYFYNLRRVPYHQKPLGALQMLTDLVMLQGLPKGHTQQIADAMVWKGSKGVLLDWKRRQPSAPGRLAFNVTQQCSVLLTRRDAQCVGSWLTARFSCCIRLKQAPRRKPSFFPSYESCTFLHKGLWSQEMRPLGFCKCTWS